MTLDADALEAQARDDTGLDDFGDPYYREGLERLVASMNEEAELNEIGEIMQRMRLGAHLAARLGVEDAYRKHPEIVEQQVGGPVFVIGLVVFIHRTYVLVNSRIPARITGAVLVGLPSVGDFATAQILGGANTFMIGNVIQDQFAGAGDPPTGAVLTIALMALLSLAMIFYLRSASRPADMMS